MGDMGTIGFDSAGGGLAGTAANDDILPTAYEEVWHGVSSSYVSGASGGSTLSYANTIGPDHSQLLTIRLLTQITEVMVQLLVMVQLVLLLQCTLQSTWVI